MNLKTIIYTNKDKQEVIRELEKLNVFEAHRIEITKYHPARSMNQNRYLWLILAIAMDDTGNHKDDLYQYFLDRHAPRIEMDMFGKPVEIVKTSSNYDSREMTEFIDKIRLDLHHEGIATPDPDDKRLAEIYEHYRKLGLL